MSNFKKTKHRKRQGRCFELAFRYILNQPGNHYLVHGTVTHKSGLPMAHAWIENEEGEVYDLVLNKTYGLEEFYGKFNARKMFVYTREEAAIKEGKHGWIGPWEQSLRDADQVKGNRG